MPIDRGTIKQTGLYSRLLIHWQSRSGLDPLLDSRARDGFPMSFRSKEATVGIESAIARSVNFEVTISDIARRSERRAWIVAFSAVFMSLILAGGYFYFLPLKEKVPYLVMADAYTGTSTVARLTEDFNNRSVTTSEAINRSNVAHFILARESYDVAMMKLRDWKTVYTMSGPEVATGYTNLHANNNSGSPYNVYGKHRAIRVKILSITLIGGSKASAPKGATVRFQRSLYEKSSGATRPLDSKIATLEFSYKPNLSMGEEDRIENPLGFQVTSYRVDNDYAASPPLETETLQPLPLPAAPVVEPQVPVSPVSGGLQSEGAPSPTNSAMSTLGGSTPALPAGSIPPSSAAPTPATTNTTNGANVR